MSCVPQMSLETFMNLAILSLCRVGENYKLTLNLRILRMFVIFFTHYITHNISLYILFSSNNLSNPNGNILNVTLWEDFALQFSNYNKRRTDWGPTIVLIHNAKIKEATGQAFFDDPILAIVNNTYPELLANYLNYDYLSARAILASTIEVVEQVNNFVLQLIPGLFLNFL